MNLHLDKTAFEFIIDDTAKRYSKRQDVLEKDYYVTLLLNELSQRENQGYAYFKGGTALYKALRSIRRFSEDIDLTVYIEDCPSASQAKKRLENATLKYQSLQKGEVVTNIRGSITCEYLYKSMYNFDENDALQRFEKVKVEGTSFTVSEPTEKIEIAPHIYELANDENKRILREKYGVFPFTIETISLERIFTDKIFAAEFYFERKEYSDVAKHIYDISVLLTLDKIKSFIEDRDKFNKMISLKRAEEEKRKGGISNEKRIADFEYFLKLKDNVLFFESFKKMQSIYVFDKNDILSTEYIFNALKTLYQRIKQL